VAAGVFAVGFLIFTLMLKVAVPITLGEFNSRVFTQRLPSAPARKRFRRPHRPDFIRAVAIPKEINLREKLNLIGPDSGAFLVFAVCR
jgi:hypothetical protein